METSRGLPVAQLGGGAVWNSVPYLAEIPACAGMTGIWWKAVPQTGALSSCASFVTK